MRKMRSNRSSPVVPVATEGAMTMAQMMETMRALQANVEASRIEQAKMHEGLVASQARNEELSKVTEELRQALQEQRGRPVVEEVVPSSPPRVFPVPFAQAITDTPIPASVVSFFHRRGGDDAVRRLGCCILQDVCEHAPGNSAGMVCELAYRSHNQFLAVFEAFRRAVHCEQGAT